METARDEMKILLDLKDRMDVTDLEYRYVRAVDDNDWRTCVKMFHQDAKLYVQESGKKKLIGGLPGIEAMFKDLAGRKLIFGRHYITCPTVVVSNNNATFRSYYNTIFIHDVFTRIIFGCYDDKLVKENDEWKFMEKVFTWEWHDFLVPMNDLKPKDFDPKKVWPLP